VAGKHPVASVPLVRILDRVGIHVPAIAVPVHVHSAQHAHSRAKNHLYHHPLSSLRVEYYLGPKSPPVFRTDSCFLKKKNFTHLREAYPT
jgi:hypothetical protein